ncbi:hypothetical protein [Variovorax sp. EL159]|uniref:hypothetical protein n=1 Tax=Variovorax sp. EL159 TaxID=1566270 RepID=UPI0008923723|nr:hypothetical protein [Variovorax sp. EL159]SCX70959.1 hypothetical protein SAMN03159363_3719 [Variovorax sp. EL159]
MIGKLVCIGLGAFLMVGCAHKAEVGSTSAAYEVRRDRVQQTKAYVAVSGDLANLEKVVKPGQICGAHSYPLSVGPAIKTSIVRTVSAAHQSVVPVQTSSESGKDGVLYTFALDDFNPRLRFQPGFFSATADASVELSIRTTAVSPDGRELATTTVRGFGQESVEGDCPVGAEALSKATEKAVRVSLENFVARVINQRLD